MNRVLLMVVCGLLACAGCEEKFNLNSLPNPGQSSSAGDTSYVEISPPWGGFASPRAIIVGGDHLVYVADYENNEVVMLDAGGRILKRRSVLHPISLAQNSKLDLYVGGETIAPNGRDTIGAIYRISTVRYDTTTYDTLTSSVGTDSIVSHVLSTYYDHNIDSAHMVATWQEPSYPARRYPGISVMSGNDLLVARIGPDNSSPVDPDSRVLETIGHDDTYLYAIGDLATRPAGGTFITDIRNVTGIMSFPASRSFVLTQSTQGVVYGAVQMGWVSTATFEGWLPVYNPANAAQRGVDLIRPYRFVNAVAAAWDPKRNELFVLDAGLDSVVKFNSKGQFRTESFGRALTSTGDFPRGLDQPMGIAYSSDCTLYIADTGNKVIRRFRLSTQTQCRP